MLLRDGETAPAAHRGWDHDRLACRLILASAGRHWWDRICSPPSRASIADAAGTEARFDWASIPWHQVALP